MNHKNIPAAILAERKRQRTDERYTLAHDDEYVDGDLRIVAQAYYWHAVKSPALGWQTVPIRDKATSRDMRIPLPWPWAPRWWKPKTPQRDLERAGALCIAELERLERRVEQKLVNDQEAHADSRKEVERLLGWIVAAYNKRTNPKKPAKPAKQAKRVKVPA
jgi:hypothetical protein